MKMTGFIPFRKTLGCTREMAMRRSRTTRAKP